MAMQNTAGNEEARRNDWLNPRRELHTERSVSLSSEQRHSFQRSLDAKPVGWTKTVSGGEKTTCLRLHEMAGYMQSTTLPNIEKLATLRRKDERRSTSAPNRCWYGGLFQTSSEASKIYLNHTTYVFLPVTYTGSPLNRYSFAPRSQICASQVGSARVSLERS